MRLNSIILCTYIQIYSYTPIVMFYYILTCGIILSNIGKILWSLTKEKTEMWFSPMVDVQYNSQ